MLNYSVKHKAHLIKLNISSIKNQRQQNTH